MTRTLPSDLAAEQSVLGAILLDNSVADEVFALLSPEDFFSQRHVWLFEAMKALYENHSPIDEVTIAAELTTRQRIKEVKSSYIGEITDRVPTAANAIYYAGSVLKCATARRVIESATAASEAAFNQKLEVSLTKLSDAISITEQQQNSTKVKVVPAQEIWPVLGSQAYIGPAGEFVRALEPHTEADNVAVLVQFLVAFGNIIGRGPHFVAEADRHHTNEFVVLVGNTSKGRKGSSWGHIRKLVEMVEPEWLKHNVRTGLSSGEGLVHAVRDDDASSEPDKRLLVLEGEFASTLASAGREGNTLSATVRNAWDGTSLGSLTKNSPNRATNPHVSIIGHITEQELKKRLAAVDIGNGFANRFLWVCVRRSKCLPEGGRFGETEQMRFADIFREAITFARTVKEVRRDTVAKDLWAMLYGQIGRPKAGVLDALTSRGEAHVMRFACLYALLDQSATIRAKHLHAALAIWEYVEASCRYIFGETVGDPTADLILRALRANPDGLDRTSISILFNRNRKSGELLEALETLARMGLAKSRRVPQPIGAPKEVWSLINSDSETARVTAFNSSNSYFAGASLNTTQSSGSRGEQA